MRQDESLEPESQKYLALVFSRNGALLNRCGMQRRGSPRTRGRGAFLLLVACALASEGIGIVGILAGEVVESRDVAVGGQTLQRRLTAGDGGGYDGAAVSNTVSAAKDNDAFEKGDAKENVAAPDPPEAVQVNGVQDLEMEELKKAVNELPPEVLKELPPELWGSRELKEYKRAEENIRKGKGALAAGAVIGTIGILTMPQLLRVGLLAPILWGLVISGVIASPVAIGGVVRRNIGRRQKKRLKDLLMRKKKRMELRMKDLPMLTPQDSGQPQGAE